MTSFFEVEDEVEPELLGAEQALSVMAAAAVAVAMRNGIFIRDNNRLSCMSDVTFL
jgi:hypothetical protein